MDLADLDTKPFEPKLPLPEAFESDLVKSAISQLQPIINEYLSRKPLYLPESIAPLAASPQVWSLALFKFYYVYSFFFYKWLSSQEKVNKKLGHNQGSQRAGLPNCWIIEKIVFLTNTQSRFSPVVIGGVLSLFCLQKGSNQILHWSNAWG